ncbi:PREDICTED: A-kinase anchor protein 14 [Propithecus coquereli]|uniref:A-kinase anchor protein 14 n=1 Tax=Propithecus coquereli TaxID=379532 RepID=UPI00063F5C0E|nr:PREDICTED: A-kinase anchor protein 14 [Propithecus coquereli]
MKNLGFQEKQISAAKHNRQKKMNVSKNVNIKKKVRFDDRPIIHGQTDNQDDSKVTAVALAIVKDAIDAAVEFVEDAENPIKNIKWITHGEFTAERGRKQIAKFVSEKQISAAKHNRQKKMNVSKNVNIKKKVRFDDRPIIHGQTDNQDDSKVTAVALAIVKDAIDAAVEFVEDAENPIKNIKWITHGEFTAERGRKQIAKFVSKWEHERHWVNYTEFVERKDVIHSFHYIYCVRWSVPTAQRPMGKVTAAAYFTIKINKNKPPDAPIDVSYIFEELSLVQRPGMLRFREKWPRDIIDIKNILIQSVKSSLNIV